jgi:hypothetical protein
VIGSLVLAGSLLEHRTANPRSLHSNLLCTISVQGAWIQVPVLPTHISGIRWSLPIFLRLPPRMGRVVNVEAASVVQTRPTGNVGTRIDARALGYGKLRGRRESSPSFFPIDPRC